MKKIAILLLIAVMGSCASTKVERQAERTFKGDWTLTKITYPNSSGFVDVNLFNDASANCFRNSDWSFISNNNKGSYILSGTDCSSQPQEFVWSVQEVQANSNSFNFTLKPVDDGENARKIDTGFRMSLVNLSENAMVWEQNVTYNGEPFLIRMQFNKKF